MKLNKRKSIFIFSLFALLFIVVCFFLIVMSRGQSFYHYAGQIKMYAELNDLDPAMVASLIQVESGFNAKAVSGKGAVGLMQLMPETAKYIAKRIGYEKRVDLKSAECNICLGTAYLAYLSDKFDNDIVVLCAYNAGEGRVSGWLKDLDCSSDGENLIYIPFAETREYVARISKYMSIYEKKFNVS